MILSNQWFFIVIQKMKQNSETRRTIRRMLWPWYRQNIENISQFGGCQSQVVDFLEADAEIEFEVQDINQGEKAGLNRGKSETAIQIRHRPSQLDKGLWNDYGSSELSYSRPEQLHPYIPALLSQQMRMALVQDCSL